MINYSMLYPCGSEKRSSVLLDGLWRFQFDPDSQGIEQHWTEGLPAPISMPVPASFSDFFTTPKERDYCGDFWYETEFYLPEDMEGKKAYVRFGSITHRAEVFCNGKKLCEHEGGFLPVLAELGDAAQPGQLCRLLVKANNELSETTLPCGTVRTLSDGRKVAKPYFDFFNYSGIHRSVWLLLLPEESVQDYSVSYEREGEDALVHYTVETNGDHPVQVTLRDKEGNVAAEASGKTGTLLVRSAKLWQVRDAYLYQIEIRITDGETLIDRYTDRIGIRTIAVEGEKILVNGKPVYLKGFGKHEDFDVLGRGFSWAVAKRDYECMKWIGANCFRTSHYPYAEEWYRFADEEGFLIIDEVPAVGMIRSFINFADAGSGKAVGYFEGIDSAALLSVHKQQTEEMFRRDKNHPSVFAWSLFNEPETTSTYARDYFRSVFDFARTLDPQNRPLTGAFVVNSTPDTCLCYSLCDFICLNRYYGWYISGGEELVDAEKAFLHEMDQWKEKALNKPFVFTEFGADTLALEHKLPGVMWTQEYQNEYLEMNFSVFDRYPFVQGELLWNFADFQTSQGIMRVNGNKKGVFTRSRQPKDAAFFVKNRWSGKE